MSEEHEALTELMYQLQESYKGSVGDQYVIPPAMVKTNIVCAAIYENDWHR